MNVTVARDFINKVRKTLVEKGIPLDKGHRDFCQGMWCQDRGDIT